MIGNYGTSDYDALQLQFRRRLADGLQGVASYSWAHSIDTGSTGSVADSLAMFIRGNWEPTPTVAHPTSTFEIRRPWR